MLKQLREMWCELAHAGGRVQRDPSGRINWQCSTCGRWSAPVSLEDERRAVDRDLNTRLAVPEGKQHRAGINDDPAAAFENKHFATASYGGSHGPKG